MESEGMTLTRRGSRWWACCPFHGDTSPSLSVSERDGGQVWHCFGCKRGGGAVEYLSEVRDVPEFEARREWAALNGWDVPDGDRELLTNAVEGLSGHQFLLDRGISEETRRRFRVGYCEDYGTLLESANLSEDRAIELGLFDVSGCIVYPFYDRDGVYKVAARRVDVKEYRTSPETSKFFRLGLWGMHLLRGEEAWIFEGYHDAMVARQAGYQAVAACGTDMSPSHWEDLRRAGVKRAVIVPDGDEGGRVWLEKSARSAPKDVSLELVVLQSGDPDDAILAGTFKSLPRLNPFEWYVTYKWGSPSGLAEKCRMLQEASPVYSRMPAQDRAAARAWFIGAFGDDESLSFLADPVQRDVEAEKVVIANCLYSGTARLEALQELEPSYFTGERHRKAFELIRDVEATPQLLQVEMGIDFSDRADLTNAKRYVDRVALYGRASKVSEVLRNSDPANVGEIIERLYLVTDKVIPISGVDQVHRVMASVNDRVANPRAPGVEICGFPSLHKSLLGWRPKKLILISGNSGHGKTTTACNFVNSFVDEWPSLFVSLEMTDEEIMEKMIAIRSGIPSMKMITGSMEQFEYDEVAKAADSLMHGNLEIVTGVTDLHRIVAICKAHVMRRKVRFIVIDYLQLITIGGSREERWEQLALITKTLKTQVCSAGPTVIALTQLKKSALNSDVPDAADQAGAYAMLADADAAMTVRKVDPRDTKDGSNYLINLSKNRFGWDEVQVPCLFDRNSQRIEELTS
jgi:replicative DNA helicase